jgi:hypothetical protein
MICLYLLNIHKKELKYFDVFFKFWNPCNLAGGMIVQHFMKFVSVENLDNRIYI